MLLDEDLERMSTCELEVDIVAADILNRLDVNDNIGVNPGLTALWNDEKERRRLKGLSSQCGLSQSQERENLISSPCEEALKNRLQKIIQFHQMYGQHTTHSQDGAKSSLDSVYPASLVESHSFTDDSKFLSSF
ncbi:DNA polymerase zeta catalytic subunit [Octopus bimaculoides]|uniref:Uncharacterized protein n=1 Tax=Octopus bimaculoides TaxID=37653 RepID=A0A0L8G7A2_OCTBM|nr:DNA polymerase zeta catalytic subunit [Octopus bimaculoides]|eukprot:XP_014783417.1 PREDICTED: DNA polymerase zeta catalytic subunit-like [Octopus bimaculoides]